MPVGDRIAVLLNGNARRVNRHVAEALADIDGTDVYMTRTLDQAHDVSRRVVEQGYATVLIGGGDGTFVEWSSDIVRRAEEKGAPAPRFVVLPLGTGNALATSLGTTAPTPWELRRLVRRAREANHTRPIDLLAVGDKLTPFAGFGLDALILEDHHAVERALRAVGVKVGSGAGYALSIALRSIPRFAITEYPEITITNIGEPAQALDELGQPCGEAIPAGDVLYRGRASIAAASTIPYVGLALRLFPHAGGARGRMNLRVSDAGVLEILGHILPLWRGTWRSPSIQDYLCTAVLMESRPECSFQIGGDVIGRRDRVVVELAEKRVRVLS